MNTRLGICETSVEKFYHYEVFFLYFSSVTLPVEGTVVMAGTVLQAGTVLLPAARTAGTTIQAVGVRFPVTAEEEPATMPTGPRPHPTVPSTTCRAPVRFPPSRTSSTPRHPRPDTEVLLLPDTLPRRWTATPAASDQIIPPGGWGPDPDTRPTPISVRLRRPTGRPTRRGGLSRRWACPPATSLRLRLPPTPPDRRGRTTDGRRLRGTWGPATG